MGKKPVVQHYSDVLCVWAYVSNIRFERLMQKYSDQVVFELRYCSVFPDTIGKINAGWGDRGGFEGYGAHVKSVADDFEHVVISPDVWSKTRPVSSTAAHIALKAAELQENSAGVADDTPLAGRAYYRMSWAMRQAFFRDGLDIARWDVQRECAKSVGLQADGMLEQILSGAAVAALDSDMVAAQKAGITGSPTFYMNGGRQVLYGNVGYNLLDANIVELLRLRGAEEASWC